MERLMLHVTDVIRALLLGDETAGGGYICSWLFWGFWERRDAMVKDGLL